MLDVYMAEEVSARLILKPLIPSGFPLRKRTLPTYLSTRASLLSFLFC